MFFKKGVLKNFAKFTGKHLCQSLFFDKVAGLRHRCFPLNFAKFLRTSFIIEHLRYLLLIISFREACRDKLPTNENIIFFQFMGIWHLYSNKTIISLWSYSLKLVWLDLNYKTLRYNSLKTILLIDVELKLEARANVMNHFVLWWC